MGLDGTIKRADGKSLGSPDLVQSALSEIFPGVTLKRSLSGLEKIRNAEAQGVIFPAILREHTASSPPTYEGTYDGNDFSIEFYMNVAEVLPEVHVVLRGKTTSSDPLFALLE